MKKILLLCIHTFLFATVPDQALLDYQKKYSLCHGKDAYKIVSCLLNGHLNYASFRGDRNIYRKISSSKIKKAVSQGNAYTFTLDHLPQTQRYTKLKEFADYLYSIRDVYVIPEFKGDEEEDILRSKYIFNLLQDANLELTPERTSAFEEALLTYQERHGLTVDGDIGRRTKDMLKQSIKSMVLKVKKNLTLERISLPKPKRYVLVNIPELKMHYYEAGTEVLQMKVVVGKTKMRTPIFSRKIKFIVQNPTWNVPPSIYKKEYAHKSVKQLRKLGLRYNASGKLYQPSGGRNALGKVKFLFPNKFNVYMHDTPAKSRFKRTRRAFSHGCIRLEKPLEFLNKLGFSYRSGKTTWTKLEEQVPVFVEYHTVWVDDEGIIQFRADIYGYEKKLFTTPVIRRSRSKIHSPTQKPAASNWVNSF